MRVRGTDGGVAQFDKAFDLDHISLENDRGTWHITSPKSKAHQGGPNVLDLGQGRVFWFSMAVSDLSILRTAKRRTTAAFRVNEKAIQHKVTQFQGAITGGVSVKVPLPMRPSIGDWFPLLAVVVGPKGFPLHNGPEWGVSYGSSHITGESVPNQRLSVNQFPLDDTTDVQLATTWIPGKMAIPLILTSPKP